MAGFCRRSEKNIQIIANTRLDQSARRPPLVSLSPVGLNRIGLEPTMPLVTIGCPFCSYSKEVEKESIPVSAKSVTCPKCRRNFPVPVIVNTVTKTTSSAKPEKQNTLTLKDKLLRKASEFTLGAIVLRAVFLGLSMLNIWPKLTNAPHWLWNGAVMRFAQVRVCYGTILAYKRVPISELLPIAGQGMAYLISALVLLIPFIPVVWLCVVIGKAILASSARFRSKE